MINISQQMSNWKNIFVKMGWVLIVWSDNIIIRCAQQETSGLYGKNRLFNTQCDGADNPLKIVAYFSHSTLLAAQSSHITLSKLLFSSSIAVTTSSWWYLHGHLVHLFFTVSTSSSGTSSWEKVVTCISHFANTSFLEKNILNVIRTWLMKNATTH